MGRRSGLGPPRAARPWGTGAWPRGWGWGGRVRRGSRRGGAPPTEGGAWRVPGGGDRARRSVRERGRCRLSPSPPPPLGGAVRRGGGSRGPHPDAARAPCLLGGTSTILSTPPVGTGETPVRPSAGGIRPWGPPRYGGGGPSLRPIPTHPQPGADWGEWRGRGRPQGGAPPGAGDQLRPRPHRCTGAGGS